MARKLDTRLQEERRRQILDAALACFRRSGFRGASMSEICQEAGMSPGHLYHYFPGKEAIVEAITAQGLERALSVFAAAGAANQFAGALVEGLVAEITVSIRVEAPIFVEIVAEAGRNPKVAGILEDFYRTLDGLLLERLRAAQREGRLDAALDAEGAVVQLAIITDGYLARCATDPRFDSPGSRGHLRQMLLRALSPAGTGPGKPRPPG